MSAIFRREVRAYFTSPVAYIYYVVFAFFAGLFFAQSCLMYQTTELAGVLSNMFLIIIFLIPVLTMKLFSEERKLKTDQCLFTAPVSLPAIVLGKYFAALFVFGLSLLLPLLYACILSVFSPVVWSTLFGNLIGLFLLGAAFIAAGLFVSALTESQAVAAIGGFILIMCMYLIEMLASVVSNSAIKNLITKLAFYTRYIEFSSGIFNIASVVFFLSVTAFFLFLTGKTLEKRRWN